MSNDARSSYFIGDIQLWIDGTSVIKIVGLTLRQYAETTIQGMHCQTFFGGKFQGCSDELPLLTHILKVIRKTGHHPKTNALGLQTCLALSLCRLLPCTVICVLVLWAASHRRPTHRLSHHKMRYIQQHLHTLAWLSGTTTQCLLLPCLSHGRDSNWQPPLKHKVLLKLVSQRGSHSLCKGIVMSTQMVARDPIDSLSWGCMSAGSTVSQRGTLASLYWQPQSH